MLGFVNIISKFPNSLEWSIANAKNINLYLKTKEDKQVTVGWDLTEKQKEILAVKLKKEDINILIKHKMARRKEM